VHTFLFTALEQCSAPVYSADVTVMLHSIESSEMTEVTLEPQMNETRCGKTTLLKTLPITVTLFEIKKDVLWIQVFYLV
jgi:hypothetical protein